MLLRKFIFRILYVYLAVFLIVACSSQKSIVIEKERILVIEKKEDKTDLKTDEIPEETNANNSNNDAVVKKTVHLQPIKLWVKIKNGEIVDNAILSGVDGSFDFQRVEINGQGTKLFVHSNYNNQTWVFDVPLKNGEHVITGNLK